MKGSFIIYNVKSTFAVPLAFVRRSLSKPLRCYSLLKWRTQVKILDKYIFLRSCEQHKAQFSIFQTVFVIQKLMSSALDYLNRSLFRQCWRHKGLSSFQCFHCSSIGVSNTSQSWNHGDVRLVQGLQSCPCIQRAEYIAHWHWGCLHGPLLPIFINHNSRTHRNRARALEVTLSFIDMYRTPKFLPSIVH